MIIILLAFIVSAMSQDLRVEHTLRPHLRSSKLVNRYSSSICDLIRPIDSSSLSLHSPPIIVPLKHHAIELQPLGDVAPDFGLGSPPPHSLPPHLFASQQSSLDGSTATMRNSPSPIAALRLSGKDMGADGWGMDWK